MKSILLPTDFSDIANNALQYAIHIAQRTNARLTVYHAYRMPLVVGNEVELMFPAVQEDYEKSVNDQLKELKMKFPDLRSVQHELKAQMGALVDATSMLSDEKQADLLVMGTSGASGLSEVLGTRTTDVIDKLDIPVLVVPEHSVYSGVQKIAFAYDYREIQNPQKLDILKTITQEFDAELHILYVAKSEEAETSEDFSTLAAIDSIFENVRHEYRVRVKNDVEQGISDYVSENNIDLLVVLPRKHGILDGLFNRSITKKLAYHTHIPLLIVQD